MEAIEMNPNKRSKSCNLNDEVYFDSYEDIEIHRLMVEDEPRTLAYKQAILQNTHLFKDKIVMDVGAGTGILSLFAASAGAKKVYAVEASGTAPFIRQVARDNNYQDVIEVLHSRVEDIQLPDDEKVDMIISEWMGFYLLHESMLNSVLFARDKFLSEDGRMFPSEARLYASPCCISQIWKEKISFWDKVHGFDMSAFSSYALKSKQTKPEVCILEPQNLLAKPQCFQTLNLRWMDSSETNIEPENVFVSIDKNGTYHGICVWFECDFDGVEYDSDGEAVGKLITLSTSPLSPPTHWKQTVIMLGQEKSSQNSEGEKESCESIELESDEIIGWSLSMKQSDENARHYTIELQLLDPEVDEHPEPCDCGMAKCAIIAKIIEKEMNGESLLTNGEIL